MARAWKRFAGWTCCKKRLAAAPTGQDDTSCKLGGAGDPAAFFELLFEPDGCGQHRRHGKQGTDGYEVPTGGRRQQPEDAVDAIHLHVRQTAESGIYSDSKLPLSRSMGCRMKVTPRIVSWIPKSSSSRLMLCAAAGLETT
ncbi:hypothetical protein GCM10023317_27130 [Actinopolymorpha pittospori]